MAYIDGYYHVSEHPEEYKGSNIAHKRYEVFFALPVGCFRFALMLADPLVYSIDCFTILRRGEGDSVTYELESGGDEDDFRHGFGELKGRYGKKSVLRFILRFIDVPDGDTLRETLARYWISASDPEHARYSIITGSSYEGSFVRLVTNGIDLNKAAICADWHERGCGARQKKSLWKEADKAIDASIKAVEAVEKELKKADDSNKEALQQAFDKACDEAREKLINYAHSIFSDVSEYCLFDPSNDTTPIKLIEKRLCYNNPLLGFGEDGL